LDEVLVTDELVTVWTSVEVLESDELEAFDEVLLREDTELTGAAGALVEPDIDPDDDIVSDPEITLVPDTDPNSTLAPIADPDVTFEPYADPDADPDTDPEI